MIELEQRLTELGDRLDLGDDRDALVNAVLERLDESADTAPPVGRAWPGWSLLRIAAAVVIVVSVAVVAVPGSRRTVAGWFGFDQARVDVRPDTTSPDPESEDASFALPLPGATRIVDVDGVEAMITTLDGRLNDDFLTKTLGGTTSVVQVDVDGNRGLWISGSPHEVLYDSADGEPVVVRVAGNTLLWQDGQVLRRVEGFDELDQAIAFAAVLD